MSHGHLGPSTKIHSFLHGARTLIRRPQLAAERRPRAIGLPGSAASRPSFGGGGAASLAMGDLSSTGQWPAGTQLGNSRILKKMSKICRSLQTLIEGHCEIQSSIGRATGLPGSSKFMPSNWGRWRGLPSSRSPQLHRPRPAGTQH